VASEEIAEQLKAVLDACARPREENKNLKSLLGIQEEKPETADKQRASIS